MRRVPVNSVVRKSVMFSNVIVDIAFLRRSFVFSQSSCEVSASLTDVGGVAVGAISMQTTFYLTLMMTSAQVVETSVTTTDNSPSQDYNHPDDQTTLLHVIPGFKSFTV